MIIGLFGRQKSGKSLLANRLVEKYGFKKLSFATSLKEILCEIYNWNIDQMDLSEYKNEQLVIPWNNEIYLKLCLLCDLDTNLIQYSPKVLYSRREALQFIGTNIIRVINPNFHIQQLGKKLNITSNFVIDDCRFENEKKFLEESNAYLIYVLRPDNMQYTNHESEIGLSWQSFKYKIINDKTIPALFNKFDYFAECHSDILNDKIEFSKIFEKHNFKVLPTSKEIGVSRSTVLKTAHKFLIPVFDDRFRIENFSAFSTATEESSYWAGVLSGDGCVKLGGFSRQYLLELSNTDIEIIEGFKNFLKSDKPIYTRHRKEVGKPLYSIIISNSFVVDDLKKWDLEPRKSRFNKIPTIIKKNDELLKYWLVGLIDSDGSIYETNQNNRKNVHLDFLASKEVIIFIQRWLPFKVNMHQEKEIENLYTLKISGQKVVSLYKMFGDAPKMGLKRKWDKIIPYLEKYK